MSGLRGPPPKRGVRRSFPGCCEDGEGLPFKLQVLLVQGQDLGRCSLSARQRGLAPCRSEGTLGGSVCSGESVAHPRKGIQKLPRWIAHPKRQWSPKSSPCGAPSKSIWPREPTGAANALNVWENLLNLWRGRLCSLALSTLVANDCPRRSHERGYGRVQPRVAECGPNPLEQESETVSQVGCWSQCHRARQFGLQHRGVRR